MSIYHEAALVQVNTLRPRWSRRHFADDIFKCTFFNETFRISNIISLKFVPDVPIRILACHRPGNKPLPFEPMVVRSLMHIYVTRPQWVKTGRHTGDKRLPEPTITHCTDAYIRHHVSCINNLRRDDCFSQYQASYLMKGRDCIAAGLFTVCSVVRDTCYICTSSHPARRPHICLIGSGVNEFGFPVITI